MTNQSVMSNEFWQGFNEKIWQKDILSIKSDFIQPPMEPADLFSLIVRNCLPENLNTNNVRFFIDGAYQRGKKCLEKGYYPKDGDGSFAGYHQRMRSILGEKDYVFVIDGVILDGHLREWLYSFLKSMYGVVGNLAYGHFFSIFYGDYRKTPFGVHDDYRLNDYEGAFFFPIEGTKKIRTWPRPYVAENPKLKYAMDYDDHLEASTLLEADRGGMLYWPAGRWHIGESKCGDISLALAVRVAEDLTAELGATLAEEMAQQPSSLTNTLAKARLSMLRKKHGWRCRLHKLRIPDRPCHKTPFETERLNEHVHELPEDLVQAGAYYEKAVGPKMARLACVKIWLKWLSCYGYMKPILAEKRNATTVPERFQLWKHHQVLWTRAYEDTVVVAANGMLQTIECTDDDLLASPLARINSGETVSMSELVPEGQANDPQRDILQNLVSWLFTTDVLHEVS